MNQKIYIDNVEELTKISQSGEKVFVEYGEKFEEIEGAKNYGYSDWVFTMRVLTNVAKVKFFKLMAN